MWGCVHTTQMRCTQPHLFGVYIPPEPFKNKKTPWFLFLSLFMESLKTIGKNHNNQQKNKKQQKQPWKQTKTKNKKKTGF
jgi:hypothetical protein